MRLLCGAGLATRVANEVTAGDGFGRGLAATGGAILSEDEEDEEDEDEGDNAEGKDDEEDDDEDGEDAHEDDEENAHEEEDSEDNGDSGRVGEAERESSSLPRGVELPTMSMWNVMMISMFRINQ